MDEMCLKLHTAAATKLILIEKFGHTFYEVCIYNVL